MTIPNVSVEAATMATMYAHASLLNTLVGKGVLSTQEALHSVNNVANIIARDHPNRAEVLAILKSVFPDASL